VGGKRRLARWVAPFALELPIEVLVAGGDLGGGCCRCDDVLSRPDCLGPGFGSARVLEFLGSRILP